MQLIIWVTDIHVIKAKYTLLNIFSLWLAKHCTLATCYYYTATAPISVSVFIASTVIIASSSVVLYIITYACIFWQK